MYQPIGIFDSGYGGLTILKSIRQKLPDYDYIYLGDNARSPYGTRSFETVYRYTLEAVEWLFEKGCPLVILACNTASAKALRTIQQKDLQRFNEKKVLGVIRPTTEIIGKFSNSGQVGILATKGTVLSESYPIELEKFAPGVTVHQHACPMWVPLVENNEHLNSGADYFIQKDLEALFKKAPLIDVLLLACTHYPLLLPVINKYVPAGCRVIIQGDIVSASLEVYLQNHPEIRQKLSQSSNCQYFTTDDVDSFNEKASIFLGEKIKSGYAVL